MKRDRLPNVDSLKAYLFTAARNRSLHHLRHRAMVRRWTSWAGAKSDVAGVAVASPPADEALEADERRARIELRAGQVAFVAANGRAAKRTGTSARTLIGLAHGQLVFDDVALSTVAAELGRWFDVEIRIPDQRLALRRVSAMYNRSTLSGVLDAIAATLPVRYERARNVVTILPAKP